MKMKSADLPAFQRTLKTCGYQGSQSARGYLGQRWQVERTW